MSEQNTKDLRELAGLYGVQHEYEDMTGRRQVVGPEALLGVLQALGVPLEGPGDVARALRERRHERHSRPVEPVVVVRDGEVAVVRVRLAGATGSKRLSCVLTLEDGGQRVWEADGASLAATGEVESEGVRVVTKLLPLPSPLPAGYHRLRVALGGREGAESLVIAAPARSYGGADERLWGLFCPLHALHRDSSWGAGNFSDLGALVDWVAGQGGGLVATLPMLASALDDGVPSLSPYSPTSRLFWNEFYVDPAGIPELSRYGTARSLLERPEFQSELASLRAEPLVDYGRQMRARRRVLEHLAEHFFEHEAGSSAEYRRFLADRPQVGQYARFMAAGERHGRRLDRWPESLRKPGMDVAEAEVDPKAVRYHLYAQWQADRQLRAVAGKARDRGLSWYVDFPVGVDANSYDVWRYPDAFAGGATVGCPPDPTFTRGQNWGFPPPHPDRQREGHYRYFIESLRCHFRYANALRIDHVMGLHRLYWVPAGLDARSGAFVSYPSDEIYAILSLESHRRGAWLVGENLGTVPAAVQESLTRHGVRGMFVVQYELARPEPDRAEALADVPAMSVASVNTHDMPTFAAFWNGDDIDDRMDLGLLDAAGAAREREERGSQRLTLLALLRQRGLLGGGDDEPPLDALLQACWAYLAGSRAHVAMLNLEDLWLETLPQNVPNTSDERPNWRRKHRLSFEQFRDAPGVAVALKRVAELRQAGPICPGRVDPTNPT